MKSKKNLINWSRNYVRLVSIDYKVLRVCGMVIFTLKLYSLFDIFGCNRGARFVEVYD